MAELTSAYPTAGGPYWWAHDLGGKGWSWMTGWFNIVGLLGIVASVAYGAAIFLNILLGLYGLNVLGINFGDTSHVLGEQFLLFLIILLAYTVVNIFADRFLAVMNNISVGWHLLGVAVVIGLLDLVPDHHQSANFVFTQRFNESGFFGGSTGNFGFWFFVAADRLPADDVHGDRLRRLRPHRRGDPGRRDQRRRRASGGRSSTRRIIGWILLLSFLFAANDVAAIDDGAGYSTFIFTSALDPWAAKLVILIATVGQLFCGAAGLTSASRTWYAFSRDRAIPGWNLFRRVNRDRVPFNAVIGGLVLLAGHLDPGAVREERRPVRVLRADRNLHGRPVRRLHHPGVPAAAGRRLVQARPVDARREVQVGQHHRDSLRDPGRVRPRPAVHPGRACRGTTASTPSLVNYTPLAVLLPLIFGVWYLVSAKNKYQGPVSTLEEDVVTRD